jgi:hypothetical protein
VSGRSIKPPDKGGGRHLKTPDSQSLRTSSNQMRPKFSLEHLAKSHCLSNCLKEEKSAFVDKLHELSQLTWQQIQQAPKHGLGHETIARSSIKAAVPHHITEDVRFLAFRFMGKAPMVGYKVDEVFFVVWIDRAFVLYDH